MVNRKRIIVPLFLLCLLIAKKATSQTQYYTVFQLGGQFGVSNSGYDGAFNGYATHFVFGLNLQDRAYVGIGLGNETFRGSYQSKEINRAGNSPRFNYDTYLMPIFLDARAPIFYVNNYSWIGVIGNAGYAPRIGPVYDRGFLFRGGLSYVYETMSSKNYTVSLSYGYQQLHRNAHDFKKPFQHQHLNLTVGLMLK